MKQNEFLPTVNRVLTQILKSIFSAILAVLLSFVVLRFNLVNVGELNEETLYSFIVGVFNGGLIVGLWYNSPFPD